MGSKDDVVITGLGVVSPIGIGADAFWASLLAARSGVRTLAQFDREDIPVRFGGEVADFDAKQYVRPRKSLKVMSREIQLGFAAASLACEHARLETDSLDPDRFGVVYGSDLIPAVPDELEAAYRASIVDGRFVFSRWGERALGEMHPLWFLKQLPNMPACHVAIAHDARGPNNSITLGEVSSLLAVAEAARVIERGQTDVMITGGTGSFLNATNWPRSTAGDVSHRNDDPASACRPFDADRDGLVRGEGAAAFVLERRARAEARGASILARIAGAASGIQPHGRAPRQGDSAIHRSITQALGRAGLEAAGVGHVNAHGLGTREDDRHEAHAIRDLLGDAPVIAPKSFFGNLGSGTGAVEMAVSLLAFMEGVLPATLNYQRPDPECPVNVVHREARPTPDGAALVLNQAPTGQTAALVLARPDV